MRERPRSKFDNDGVLDINSKGPEEADYPEVIEWDTEFAAECDRLATDEAIKIGKRRWGRWYLSGTNPISLDTMSSRVGVGESPDWAGEPYEILVKEIDFSVEQKMGASGWRHHLLGKRWIGSKDMLTYGAPLWSCAIKASFSEPRRTPPSP